MNRLKGILTTAGSFILIVGGFFGLVYLSDKMGCDNEESKPANADVEVNPRKTVGIDSTVYKDSIYIISTRIDTVYEWYIHKHLREKEEERLKKVR